MKNFEEKLNKEAQNIRLSTAEKDALRARLHEAMQGGQAPAETQSPLAPSPVEGYFFYSFQFWSARYALAALVVIVFVGGGTVSAAGGALPGDWLYAVKTGVNERIELALAASAEQKMRTEARFATRRVAEAEALQVQGRLDAATAAQIEARFDRHAARALPPASRPAEVAVTVQTADASAGMTVVQEVPDMPPVAATLRAEVGEQEEKMPTTTAPAAQVEAQANIEIEEDVSALLRQQREKLEDLKERFGEVRGDSAEREPRGRQDKDTPRVRVDINL